MRWRADAWSETMDTGAEPGYAANWTTEGTSGETTVTEAEWLNCIDLQMLLDYLPGRASHRKVRLYVCACCRRNWPLIEDRGRHAVSVAEQFTDGLIPGEELEQTREAVERIRGSIISQSEASEGFAFSAACLVLFDTPLWNDKAAMQAAAGVCHAAAEAAERGILKSTVEKERQAQICLLREIVENPYRPSWVDPSWLAWKDGLVVRLAQTAYNERQLPEGTLDNGLLAVLADALEEAGCTDTDILEHLRGPGPHVRGCWPVDLCLGKS